MDQLISDLRNTDHLENIKSIQFSLFSQEEIRRGAVCDILTPETYDGNVPKNNGLFDQSMGTIDAAIICSTDDKNSTLCPGYFGKVDLALPVFHHHFITDIEKVLKCICFRCSNLLIDKTDPNVLKELEGKKASGRFTTILAMAVKNKVCAFNGGCMVQQPTKYTRLNATTIKEKDNIVKIEAEFAQNSLKDGDKKGPMKQIFTPLICYKIFKRMKEEDIEFLGFSAKYSRPESMIITTLAVPPPAVRPSVRMSDNQRSEDDLTHSLSNIIKINNTMKQILKEGNAKKVHQYQGMLQYYVSTYMDNEIPGVAQSAQRTNYRPLKSITQRLKGKEGRIRNNIMGKRVDYTARTVISVDPCIDIDEFGMPQKIAMNLTFPEIVTKYNKARLQKMVRNGPSVYPGAKSITKNSTMCRGVASPCTITLKYSDLNKEADELQIGDIVRRHLMDGDVGLVNRQPTLHKMSMMGHRIRILPGSTFRLNIMSVSPYNADFDGDEMNCHLPQSIQTLEELKQITMVPTQIISPGTSKPCMKIMVDTLIGAYLLTQPDMKLNRQEFQNLLTFSKYYNGKLPEPAGMEGEEPYWLGRQIVSMILPDVSLPYLKDAKIIRGEMVSGFLSEDALGTKPTALIQQIYNVYGKDQMTRFMNDMEKLVTRWLMTNSFSIGFGDAVIKKSDREEINKIIQKEIQSAYDIIIKAQEGVYALDLDDSLRADKLEADMNGALSEVSEKVKKYIGNIIGKKNGFKEAIDSGSTKGNMGHIMNITALVGRFDIWGKRIPNEFTHRTLPHYAKYDLSPEAKGFSKDSLILGMNPADCFFGAMNGRNGKIDTAIKSVTGDTPIVIMENGTTKYVKIGEWIDELMKMDSDKIQLDTDGGEHREMLKIGENIYIPTTDLDGKVQWGEITHITRHNPSAIMYEVKTSGGRTVTVTDSHSLLIWNSEIGQFERKSASDVSVGSFVPTTAQLVEPDVIANHIDVSKYFAKTEYIYGTDFNKAKNMVEEIMKDRDMMPSGWWKANNGTTFTLPYPTIQRFKRVLIRSKIDGIKDNCIYSYKKRSYGNICDKFEFTEDNGLFLGLYIAEGNSDIDSGYVQITNADDEILDFCKRWFEKNNIEWSISSKINKIGGISKCIRGYSTILATIMHRIAGHGARNKMISPECFNAPESFICQLMNGIFSGDGTVTKNNIQLGSASNRLVNDVNMCLSRLGIFGKITITRMKQNNLGTENMADINLLSIRGNWAQVFQKKISFISKGKNIKLKEIVASKIHRNFAQHNDVVLDTIVEINQVDSAKYEKVYDLTVPSTLNFGLANGMHVVDTADSGYTSRKFVKATEDLVVAYDLTVRNAANVIVQFSYGDDNMDPSKIERISKIDLIEMNNKTMSDTYLFDEMLDRTHWETFMAKDSVDEMMKDPEYVNLLKAEYEEMMLHRETLRHTFFKNVELIGDIGTYVSVNPQRLIQSTLANFNVEKFHLSDLTPQYVIEKFDEAMKSITQYLPEKDESIKLQRIIMKSYLASKRVIQEYRMNKMMFDYVLKMIHMKMMNSIITPGETVGVIAAQTLGEGTTQLTLNTFHSISSAASVVTEGLPRLNEIIKLTKNMKNKNMKIYLKDEYKVSKEEAKKVKTKFAYTKMKDLLAESEIIYMGSESYTDPEEEREFIRSYQDFAQIFDLEQCKEEDLSPWMIRFVFDKESMMNRNISILEIQEKIKEKESGDIECPFSDDGASNVVMRIRYKNDKSGNVMQFMRDFEKQLSEMTIRGIDGIEIADVMEKSCMTYLPDGGYLPGKEWMIQTKGSNILDIMSDDAVDFKRTGTNDIMEFAEIFGIEAARNLVIQEYSIIYQSNGVNPRHIELMADLMAYRGKLMQIDRHGSGKNPDVGPIGKASFEAVMDVFTKAALFAEKDNMKGTSANIFAGQFCKAGTNAFEIMLDDEKMMKIVSESNELEKDITEEDVDGMIDSMYAERRPDEEVQDEDFDFGFGLELQKQSVLTGPSMAHVQIKDKKTGSMVHMNVENRDMAEETLMVPKMDEVMNEKENLQVPQMEEENDEETDLMVPSLEEEEEVVENKNKKKVVKKKEENVVPKKPRKKIA